MEFARERRKNKGRSVDKENVPGTAVAGDAAADRTQISALTKRARTSGGQVCGKYFNNARSRSPWRALFWLSF